MPDKPNIPGGPWPETHVSLILLAARAKAGDPASKAALQTFMRLYRRPLYLRAKKCGLPEDDADEVVQRLTIRIVEQSLLATWNPAVRLRCFLIACLRNEVHHYRREQMRRPGAKGPSLDAEVGPNGEALHELVAHPEALEDDQDYAASWDHQVLKNATEALALELPDPEWVTILREYVVKLKDRKTEKQVLADINLHRPENDQMSPETLRQRVKRIRQKLYDETTAEIGTEYDEGKIPKNAASDLLRRLQEYFDKGGTLDDDSK